MGDIQSAMTIVDELSSLLNSAEDPILTEEGILIFCFGLRSVGRGRGS